jgi:hypothetical protein
MATPISRDDSRAVSCSGLRPSQLTAPKTYTTPGDITRARPLSSVQKAVCRCGFKTFKLGLPRDQGAESNVQPVGPHSARRTLLNVSDHCGQRGAVWVAIRCIVVSCSIRFLRSVGDASRA